MFTRIGSILPQTLNEKGLEDGVRKAARISAFEEAARAALPEERRGDFRVLHLRNGTITLACRSAASAAALKSREADLLAAGGAERLRLILSPWR